jgi:hypothetical protein
VFACAGKMIPSGRTCDVRLTSGTSAKKGEMGCLAGTDQVPVGCIKHVIFVNERWPRRVRPTACCCHRANGFEGVKGLSGPGMGPVLRGSQKLVGEALGCCVSVRTPEWDRGGQMRLDRSLMEFCDMRDVSYQPQPSRM